MSRTIRNERDLGAYIHDARTERGWTQQHLADLAGVSRTWLVGVERGQRPGAELGKIFALLHTLEVSISLEQEPFGEPSQAASPQAPYLSPAVRAQMSGLNEALKPAVEVYRRAAQDIAKTAFKSADFGISEDLKRQMAALARPSAITLALNQQAALGSKKPESVNPQKRKTGK